MTNHPRPLSTRILTIAVAIASTFVLLACQLPSITRPKPPTGGLPDDGPPIAISQADARRFVEKITDAGDKTEHDLARLTLQCIIANQAITTTVPGLTTIHEVENAVRASYVRQLGATEAEKQWLTEMTEQRWAALDPDYAWLRDWEVV